MRRWLTRENRQAETGRGPVWEGSAGAAVLELDADGRIARLSQGAADLIGRREAEAMGAPWAALFDPADREAAAAVLNENANRASNLRLAGGRIVSAVCAPAGGGRSKALLLAADARDEDPRLAEAVEAAKADARDKADLLADLSHEMRTPLNAVIGFAEAIKSETFGPLGHDKYAEYAEHIRASGGHLLDLVSSILDLAKIEADRFILKPEITDIAGLARECAAMIKLTAEKAGLKLTTEIEDDLPESWIDPRAVRQILLNLLSNAVKFTSDGEIALAANRDGEDIVLTVTDTGVGMSEEEIAKLGARFTAAHGPGVRGAKGAGLGLALAFALAELQGGSLKLSSAPGEGVKARVRLPIRKPARPERRLKSVIGADAPAPADRPRPDVLTQLDRIEAYRREQASAA